MVAASHGFPGLVCPGMEVGVGRVGRRADDGPAGMIRRCSS